MTSGWANLGPDARFAALAIEHGFILCSTDGDFARFSGLAFENSLAIQPYWWALLRAPPCGLGDT